MNMRRYLSVPVLIVLALLLASAVGSYLLTDSGPTGARRQTAASPVIPVDEKAFLTARRLAQIADTTEEQTLAHEAIRLADRELDKAFASATREAVVKAPPANNTIKELQTRIATLHSRIDASQKQIDKLTKAPRQDDEAAAQLDLAKAQIALDQDELEDARTDLAQAGGDQKYVLDRALEEHEAVQRVAVPLRSVSGPVPASMWGQIVWWLGLNSRTRDVDAARGQAVSKSNQLIREHATLEALTKKQSVPVTAAGDDDAEETPAMIARLNRLSDQRKTLTELDKRSQDLKQLTDVYQRWLGVIAAREREILHQMLRSVTLILGVVLAALLATRGVRAYLARKHDSRSHHQAVTLSRAILWALALALAAIIFFGPPNEVSTLIGLTTAGLTVALKDFIAAIFGWFALIGKNGVHIGDWVEIEGIGGEVVDIGLFRTELLELGNWTNTGRPTGRRVSFMNTYAIEHHYFNFSTTGQWLWDDLQMTLPTSDHAYEDAQKALATVEAETRADSEAAEKDWTAARSKVASARDSLPFTARPTVDLRPSVNGLEVYVRYVTRAPQRYETKSRLFDAVFKGLKTDSEPRLSRNAPEQA